MVSIVALTTKSSLRSPRLSVSKRSVRSGSAMHSQNKAIAWDANSWGFGSRKGAKTQSPKEWDANRLSRLAIPFGPSRAQNRQSQMHGIQGNLSTAFACQIRKQGKLPFRTGHGNPLHPFRIQVIVECPFSRYPRSRRVALQIFRTRANHQRYCI